MDAELLDFTRRALAAHIARSDIAQALSEAGWPQADIAAALDSFAEVNFPVPVPKPKPYLSAWEVFIYSVMFLALYVAAFHLGSLLFELIDLKFPDPLQVSNDYTAFFSTIRWDISAMVVALPLFLYMFALANRAITLDPTKRASRPRKWLTYLTLFIAVASLVADVATLVYNLLGGEFTTRFVLKVAAAAVIAGGISAYFLIDIRKDESR